ncbi:MAG: hypothetical protein JXB07_19445 [Anaerolineae bacterium]|nr:hypothetical protein [Anaerolineae bacterium]
MKRRILPIVMILGMLTFGWFSNSTVAIAQTITPTTVVNTVDNTLMITSVDVAVVFVDPVTVEVEDSGLGLIDATVVAPPATFSRITFTLRAGCPSRATPYTLVVHNGDGSDVSLPNALTVISPTPTPNPVPPGPTNTPQPTNFIRPLVTVFSYGASSEKLFAGQEFGIEMTLQNTGQITAANIVANFLKGDFVPRESGGVKAVGDLGSGQSVKFYQSLTATTELSGKKVGILEVKVSYTDIYGAMYEEIFTLTFPMTGGGGGSAPTATPTVSPRPQLIISGYKANEDMLQPGTEFALELEVRNVGSSLAKSVSAIVGGGSVDSGGGGGTPGAGGISGGSGEFTNFAPVGSSNIQVLGDMEANASRKVSQRLIVNVSTNPGAYPLKVSFAYADEQNTNFTDDQVITLLVYKIPTLDVSFYRPLDPFYVGEMGMLPLQIANLGRDSTVLGTMTVTAGDAEMGNNTLIIGNVDPGFPVTTDATVLPNKPGKLAIEVVIEYTDDFSKTRTISKTLEVEVQDVAEMEMGGNAGEFEAPPQLPETFLQKMWRLILGFIGLDSAKADGEGEMFEDMPPDMMPSDGGQVVTPVPEKMVEPVEAPQG